MVAIPMTAKLHQSISVFEQVHTSASSLLEKNHGDLGVVRETSGFPDEIRSDLEHLNSYQVFEGASAESAVPPPAYFLAPGGSDRKHYVISRTVFAGADHTGRTNPLSHHFVVSTKDLAEASNPGQILDSLRGLYLSHWAGKPHRLNTPMRLRLPEKPGNDAPFPSSTWSHLVDSNFACHVIAFVAECLTTTPEDQSIVFVIPTDLGNGIADLIVDIFAVIPQYLSCQLSLRSHVIKMPGVAGHCRLMFTYPGTEYLHVCIRRQDRYRPVIIDLAGGSSSPLMIKDYGTHLCAALRNHGHRGVIAELVQHRDELGVISDPDGTPFSDYLTLVRQLRSRHPLQNLPRLLSQLTQVSHASGKAYAIAAAQLSKCTVDHVTAHKEKSNWPQLINLAFSSQAPHDAQDYAKRAIEQLFCFALPALSATRDSLHVQSNIVRNFTRRFLERKGVFRKVLTVARQRQSEDYILCIRRTFWDLKPSIGLDELWACMLRADDSNNSIDSDLPQIARDYTAFMIRQKRYSPLSVVSALRGREIAAGDVDLQKSIFDLLEASVSTTELQQVVRALLRPLGVASPLHEVYDRTKHSKEVQTAFEAELKVKHSPAQKAPAVPRVSYKEYQNQYPGVRNGPPRGPRLESPFSFWKPHVLKRGYNKSFVLLSVMLIVPIPLVFAAIGIIIRRESLQKDGFLKGLFRSTGSIPSSVPFPSTLQICAIVCFPISILLLLVVSLLASRNPDLSKRDAWLNRWGSAAILAIFACAGTIISTWFWLVK
jgi:hypothetical protein